MALAEWKHIWPNEGFAQYAEWRWADDLFQTWLFTGSRPVLEAAAGAATAARSEGARAELREAAGLRR